MTLSSKTLAGVTAMSELLMTELFQNCDNDLLNKIIGRLSSSISSLISQEVLNMRSMTNKSIKINMLVSLILATNPKQCIPAFIPLVDDLNLTLPGNLVANLKFVQRHSPEHPLEQTTEGQAVADESLDIAPHALKIEEQQERSYQRQMSSISEMSKEISVILTSKEQNLPEELYPVPFEALPGFLAECTRLTSSSVHVHSTTHLHREKESITLARLQDASETLGPERKTVKDLQELFRPFSININAPSYL